jgi:hypothetical protein
MNNYYEPDFKLCSYPECYNLSNYDLNIQYRDGGLGRHEPHFCDSHTLYRDQPYMYNNSNTLQSIANLEQQLKQAHNRILELEQTLAINQNEVPN